MFKALQVLLALLCIPFLFAMMECSTHMMMNSDAPRAPIARPA